MATVMDLLISVYIILCLIVLSSTSEEHCHTSLAYNDILNYLSTKRPYYYNNNEEETQSANKYTPPGCKAVKFWYFGRHGTRYPGDEDLILMVERLPKIRNEILNSSNKGDVPLCPEIIAGFQKWIPRNMSLLEESHLTPEGYQEIKSIAKRYQSRFPDLLSSHYSNESFNFKFTKSERTESSAKAFAEGLFGSSQIVHYPKPVKVDPILKFYAACTLWLKTVYKNPVALKESNLFTESSLMIETRERISKRLSLGRILSLEELTGMYTSCAFETAWGDKGPSPWCMIFRRDEIEIMAYREDLEYYYQDGHGHEINYQMATPPFQDLFRFFLEHVLNPSESKGSNATLYFSHSGATLKMLAWLGLFGNTGPITATNFLDMKDTYQWKTSQIDFMGSNLAFVLYGCPTDEEEFKVGFFFQEEPLPFPGCGDKAFCSFQEFFYNIFPIIADANFDETCQVKFSWKSVS